MNLLTLGLVAWLLLMASCIGVALFGNDRLPRDSKPLEEIVEVLENSGYVIVEAEIDEGHWEVDARKGETSYELHIDPVTGKTIFTHRDDVDSSPPAQAMKLSTLLKRVNQGGYSPVLSAEFKRGRWEVEARKGGQKRELEIEPKNGKILSDRVDD